MTQSSAMPPLVCQVCQRTPAQRMTVRRHVGMIIVQRFVRFRGPLCRDHGLELTKRYLRQTLVQGWWGYISFFVNWFVIATDLMTLSTARGMQPPSPLRQDLDLRDPSDARGSASAGDH